ncbi:hypothetical protein [Klenkia brasiliensis]|uniref:PknH-like extracellular domain-containing protein n=1 Tax=Klenkia brasiliensis TaxID=333142 RepID=A0A1G8A2B2_9ACTN|nr:hypothetical protein [Klenkia brasiliensis]SDH15048.1 hypothetical protein SAMN05660324_0024 [Klenkia brasiliensis]
MRTRLVVLTSLLALAACGQQGTGGPAPQLPDDGDALVLRVVETGGSGPGFDPAPLPFVTVHRDGRVLSLGPVAAIYPPFAWPNVQLHRVDDAVLAELVQAAQDAGVTGTADLGDPQIADARTTSITLVNDQGTTTRDVPALREGIGAPSLTAEQTAARRALVALVDRLRDLATTGRPESYRPTAVAAVARPWTPVDGPLPEQPAVSWPGPALPGEPIAPGVGCALATGEQAAALVRAATSASTLTPWTDGGRTWAVTFRPLLPHESGCADLVP